MEEEVNIQRKVLYKKVGKGSFRFNGKIIKPGQRFEAYPDQISKAFKDLIIPVDPNSVSDFKEESVIKEIEKKVIKPIYTLEKTQRNGYYNIVDQKVKKMNEKPLAKANAQALIDDLGKE